MFPMSLPTVTNSSNCNSPLEQISTSRDWVGVGIVYTLYTIGITHFNGIIFTITLAVPYAQIFPLRIVVDEHLAGATRHYPLNVKQRNWCCVSSHKGV